MDKEKEEKLNIAKSAARVEAVRYTLLLWVPMLISSVYDLLELSSQTEYLVFITVAFLALLFVSPWLSLAFLSYVGLVYYNIPILPEIILVIIIPILSIIKVQDKYLKRIDNLSYNTDFPMSEFSKTSTNTWSVASLIAPFFVLACALGLAQIINFTLDVKMYFFNIINTIPYLALYSLINVVLSYRIKFKTTIN